ncbi:hypothetical protein ACLKA7_000727 [Drosophila subpalustris]
MNSIMIHIVLSKVDTESKSNYDERKNLEKLPTWDDFCKILNRRCQFLKGQQADQSEQRHSNLRSKNASNAKSFVNIAEECLQCKSTAHYTGSCKAFDNVLIQSKTRTRASTVFVRCTETMIASPSQGARCVNPPTTLCCTNMYKHRLRRVLKAVRRTISHPFPYRWWLTVQAQLYFQAHLFKSRIIKVIFMSSAPYWIRAQKISAKQPQQTFQLSEWNLPSGIELADPHFYESNKIQLLISVDGFFDAIREEKIKLGEGMPYIINTVYGWIVGGNMETNTNIQR